MNANKKLLEIMRIDLSAEICSRQSRQDVDCNQNQQNEYLLKFISRFSFKYWTGSFGDDPTHLINLILRSSFITLLRFKMMKPSVLPLLLYFPVHLFSFQHAQLQERHTVDRFYRFLHGGTHK